MTPPTPPTVPSPTLLEQFERRLYLTEMDLYGDLIEVIAEEMGSEVGFFHLYDEASEEISLNVWTDSVIKQCRISHESHYPLREAGFWADAIRQRRAVFHNGLDARHASDDLNVPEGHFRMTNQMSAPVIVDDRIVAIVGVGNRPGDYDDDDATHMERWVAQVYDIAKHKVEELAARRVRDRDRFRSESAHEFFFRLIASISRAMELRDQYTAHHQANVARVGVMIAKQMGLGSEMTDGIEIGSLIHDIGKISIPHEILNKNGSLNTAEWMLLQTHATAGSSVLGSDDYPWPLSLMIEQHHERLDGSGYPNGLVGNMICLEARVIGVADTFDAMSADRPYRFAVGMEAAVQTLADGRSRLFDPYVVDAFLALYERDPTFDGIYPNP